MVMTSIKPNSEFLNGPFALPIAPTLAPYWNVWEGLHFGVLLENSLIYAATGSALAVGLALVPAFALSRFEPPGKKYIFALLLTGLMLPQQTVLIPLYDVLRTLHLFDTRIGLIVVHGVYGMPSQILILRGFMTTIPRDIEKAAQIEGATDFQIFTKVILPLSVPGIVVGYTLNFIAIWKEFVFAPRVPEQRIDLPGHGRHAQAQQRPLHLGVQSAVRRPRHFADPDRDPVHLRLPLDFQRQLCRFGQGLKRRETDDNGQRHPRRGREAVRRACRDPASRPQDSSTDRSSCSSDLPVAARRRRST